MKLCIEIPSGKIFMDEHEVLESKTGTYYIVVHGIESPLTPDEVQAVKEFQEIFATLLERMNEVC